MINYLFDLALDKFFSRDKSLLKCVPMNKNGDYLVLLHGLNRTSRSMNRLQRAFEQKGYQVINLTYPSRKYTIGELAKFFLTEIITKRCINKKKKIHFVTHSLGGIILRQYLSNNILPNIGNIVMIAPPNHGSKWVDFLKNIFLLKYILGTAGKQLGTNKNSFVNKLSDDIPGNLGIIACTSSHNPFSMLIFKKPNDGTVTVESTKLESAREHITIDTNHCFAPQSSTVVEQAVHFVEFGCFD